MNATTKVSQYIPDISPTLSYRKDRVVTTFPSTRRHHVKPSMEAIQEIEPSAAWDKLPNLSQYKSAIVRRKVCQGLVYLIPSDKNSRSLARPYTADLNQIFHEPYSSIKADQYNEDTLKQACQVHFRPTPSDVQLSQRLLLPSQNADINSDSNNTFKEYGNLAIKRGNFRQRKDNLPTTVKGGPADKALQEEVREILNDVGINDSPLDEDDEQPASIRPNTRSSLKHITPASSPEFKRDVNAQRPASQPAQSSGALNPKGFRGHNYHKKSAGFRDYKELRDAEVKKPVLPDELRSQYLSKEKCDQIWSWLHWDFKKTKFEQFLEVCN